MAKVKKDITLQDVVHHIQGVKNDLQEQMKGMEKRLRTDFKNELKKTESNLTNRIDALDEDLTATMQDTITIRRHIGMPIGSE